MDGLAPVPPADDAPAPVLFSPRELAARLGGLSVNTLRDKAQAKEIPHYRVGGRLFFRLDEVLAWLESLRVEPAENPWEKHGLTPRRVRSPRGTPETRGGTRRRVSKSA